MQPLQCASHHPVANLHLSTLHAWQHQMTTIMQPFNAICRKRIELRTQTQPLVAEHKRRKQSRPERPQPRQLQPPHTRGTFQSSPAAATLHGKTQGFVLRLPPQHNPHATFTQPLQCVSQHPVANPHLSTRMATPDDNNHAAIPMRSATTTSGNAKNYAHNYAHRHNHSLQNTEEEAIASGTTAATTTPHIGTFHRQLRPLYTEKHKVSCSGFLPNTTPIGPCNIHAAITMRFAASRSKPASLYTHGNTR